MRRIVLMGGLALAACGGKAQPAPELEVISTPATITLAIGDQRQVNGSTIRFAGVKSDSRCPSDVQCVWAGDAEIDLTMTAGGGTPEHLALHTGQEPRTASLHGLAVTLLSLAPVPVSTDTKRDYRAELRVVAVP